jgi:Na+:H+ antiporter, NhaA family
VSQAAQAFGNRLDPPVAAHDHVLGNAGADITLVEYGSYDCPHCRTANERIAQVRDQLGDRLRYVFRHRPLTRSDLARRAAELAERAPDEELFWQAHVALMTRSATLTEEDLRTVADDLGLERESSQENEIDAARARERVQADELSAQRSGVSFTPTFFVNGRRYDGPWDESSFADAMLGSLGHRVRAAALDFASWAPSAGLLLLLASIVAIVVANSPWASAFDTFWRTPAGFGFGNLSLRLSLLDWINDGLLSVFFLVVGLEIKREFSVGHLASRHAAALPVAAAFGGMLVPALIYALVIPAGPWSRGWGVPMPTDTAFAVALIAMMGRRVPVELRIFLTAAAIVDDIGTIVVIALFYSSALNPYWLAVAVLLMAILALLNYARVYRVAPYLAIGILLWLAVHAAGLHATLTGVLLALFIPTRPPANLNTLMIQANSIIEAEAEHGQEVLRHGPSLPALRALDAIHDRLESPADRMLRTVAPRSSYLVLPLFALANAGVTLSAHLLTGRTGLALAILGGLVLGKPAGIVLGSVLAVRARWAEKPADYSWRQLLGAGALGGIGFTMSLFIAGESFPVADDFAAAKFAVLGASLAAGVAGVAVLWNAPGPAAGGPDEAAPDQTCAVEQS